MGEHGVGWQDTPDVEVDLYTYLKSVWRLRYVLLSLLVVAVVAALAANRWLITPTYEGRSAIQVGLGDATLGLPSVYIEILKSDRVMEAAAHSARVSTAQLAGMVNAELSRNSNLASLIVRGGSPAQVEAVASAWYEAFLSELQRLWTDRLNSQMTEQAAFIKGARDFLETHLEGVSGRVILMPSDVVAVAAGELEKSRLKATRVAQHRFDDVQLIAPFIVNPNPVAPNRTANVAAAAAFALFIGALLPVVVGVLSSHVR